MEEIKNISNLTFKTDHDQDLDPENWLQEEEELKGEEMLVRQQINDIYEEIKTKLESKNVTLEQIILTEMNINQNQLATEKGISACLDKLGVVITKN